MIDLGIFFSSIRKTLFTNGLTKGQVDGLEKTIAYWQDNWSRMPLDEMAYVLATIYHETGKVMRPVKEGGGERYLRSKKYWPFVGTGLIQITWRQNWERWGIKTVEDGLSWPIALRATFEGMVTGAFTGKRLSDYIGKGRRDYVNARRVINGVDKAQLIAGYAEKFRAALVAAEQQEPIAPPKPDVASAEFIAMLKLALQDEAVREEIIAIVFPDEPEAAEPDPFDELDDTYGQQEELAFADAEYDRDERIG